MMTIKTICARDAKKGMLTIRETGMVAKVAKVEYLTYGVVIYFEVYDGPAFSWWINLEANEDFQVIWQYSWEEEQLINNPLTEKNGNI